MHYRVPVLRIYTYTYNNEFGQVLNFAVTCWYKRKGCLFWLNSKPAMFLISLVFFYQSAMQSTVNRFNTTRVAIPFARFVAS